MGCHKKDTVQIPNSKEHLLIMKNVGDEVKAAAAEPLHLPSSLLSCNELMVLSRSVEATLYLSRVIPRSAKAVNLPYKMCIRDRDRRADIYPDGAAHTAAEGDDADEAEHAQ